MVTTNSVTAVLIRILNNQQACVGICLEHIALPLPVTIVLPVLLEVMILLTVVAKVA
jgi:hypothetical protein